MPPYIQYKEISERAARLCEVPAALLGFINEHQQWFRSTFGEALTDQKGSSCFCVQAVCGTDLYIVEDASADPLFRDDPLVRDKGIRFYAGMPLVSRSGFPLGTLAVFDHVPRRLSHVQAEALRILAAQVLMEIELERQSRTVEALETGQRCLAEALKERTRHLESAQRLNDMGSWEIGLRGRQLRCSDEMYRIFGLERTQAGEDINAFMQLIHAEDRQQVVLALEHAMKDRSALDTEFRVSRADGSERFVHMRAELGANPAGEASLSGTVQDITEKRQAAEHLRLLETSVAHLNDMVMITDAMTEKPGPRIVFVNAAFEKHTGYRREEVIGQSPRMLQGPQTDRAQLERVHDAMRRRQPVCVEVLNYRKDGEAFWVEIDIVPVSDTRGTVTHFVAVQRNITDRKQRTLELEKTTRALQMLKRCNEALMRAEDQAELLHRICVLAVESDGYQLAWVGLVRDDERKTIRPVAHAGKLRDPRRAGSAEISWSPDSEFGRGPIGRAVRERKPVLVEDIRQDPSMAPWQEWADSEGFRSIIALPLMIRDTTFGVLVLYDCSARSFSQDEIRLMQDLASDVSFGIEHLRAQQRQRRLEAAIVKVATSVSASTGNAFFEQLACNMTDAVRAQAGFIARIIPGEPLKCRTIVAVVDGKLVDNFEYVIKGTPCEHLLTESSCVVLDKVAERFPESPPLKELGARAYVGSRLTDASGQLMGLLFVLFRTPLKQVDLVNSTFRIFAARAASELERQEADQRIRDQASLLDKAQDAIIVCDTTHRITFWNKSAERLYGWTAEEVLQRRNQELLYDDPDILRLPMEAVLRDGEWTGEMHHRRKDGSPLIVEARWTRISGDDGSVQSILAIHTDITMRKAAEEKVQQLAFYDQLTRLPNRSSLLDRLQHAIGACARHRKLGALMLIDLDNFKTLNDTLGHDKGDMLLQQVASRLLPCVRQTDTVARLGGDEFVALLEDLSSNPAEAAMQAEHTAEKILGALNQPYRLEAYEHISTPSIGVALFRGGGDTVDEVLKRADLAMYQAKGAGRNTIRFFDPVMQAAVKHRLGLEADLRHAARSNEFVLYYQAQVDRDGIQTGAEALVRWEQPNRGVVSPAEFIPLAEETGIILRLGAWVLESACSTLAEWQAEPQTAHMTMSVNVSARQFRHPDFVEQVFDVLDRTGADPRKLKLELTESLLVDDIETIIEKMTRLKDRGVGFSLDDFGTGYSSLSYLKRFPLDQLKIDRSFVRDVLVDPNDAAIARTIVALGKSLGLTVIAEGVETEAQRNFLAEHGCEGYQGYLFSQPVPAGAFISHVRALGTVVH
ncbi:EAL domain-containing protein [Noviherbaspirillum sp.]|uniref:EAL domain-containing protein n=1 Tax=Noviherbaspirillum sp. TaxID=1926288 RepID=UPI002D62A53E|nr:EAL domain-containing protein [Noviherbaspirillum sp.]HZW21374.1 EAL domain-containing protein [Noviherbaspirillum sp.]